MAASDFIRNRKKKSIPEFLDSFAENGKPIDKTKVVGCSSST